MPAVSSVTWAPEGADQGCEPVNSVLKEEPAHWFYSKMREKGKCEDENCSLGSGWVLQLFPRAAVAPLSQRCQPSQLGRGACRAGSLQGGAD